MSVKAFLIHFRQPEIEGSNDQFFGLFAFHCLLLLGKKRGDLRAKEPSRPVQPGVDRSWRQIQNLPDFLIGKPLNIPEGKNGLIFFRKSSDSVMDEMPSFFLDGVPLPLHHLIILFPNIFVSFLKGNFDDLVFRS